MSHPGGGLAKDYHDRHYTRTTTAADSSDFAPHPVCGLTKDYLDCHDSFTTNAAADLNCVSHPGGGLTKDNTTAMTLTWIAARIASGRRGRCLGLRVASGVRVC